ncbi:Cc8l18.2-like protein [Plakobranchus ocellatus]|uniref:Cc8l18.2-like protein n=1 Tax=Plakobranchus ocellatus TaxID=259542 RepID=A0AAV4A0R5_9GAST|nr:Cc8l18.2-like protein [Plakobranchus ocellatus]
MHIFSGLLTERPKRDTRRKLDFEIPETPQHISRQVQNKLNRAAYKARLKTNPAAYEAYNQLDAQRARERRQRKKQTMTEEELQQLREKGRARQRAYRQCLCEVCLNPMLKVKVLNKKLPENERVDSLKDFVRLTVCDANNLVCVSRECSNCGVWMLDKWKNSLNVDDNVEWTKWESIAGVKLKGTRIDLRRKDGTVEELLAELKVETSKLPLHDFVQNWQLKQYSKLCASVLDGWAIVTLDFSENYLCEKQDQPQSSYYGYMQVTVHPCVLYYNCSCGDRKTDNVTIITDELNHSSALVEQIVHHVMNYLQEKLPSLKKVVIFSDGCASQYKSKIPFAHTLKLGEIYNVERCYFGPWHGKNHCDALGGILKQAATRAVKARQSVIQNATDLHRFASETLSILGVGKCSHLTRRFWLLEATHGKERDSCSVPIYGTRQLHSLLPTADGLFIRNLSCFCQHCIAGHFGACDSQHCVSEWKSVREWEKLCKSKGKLQRQIVAGSERNSILNNAFIEDGTVCELGDDYNVFPVNPGVSRGDFFREALNAMAACSIFADIEKIVRSVLPHLDNYPLPVDIWPTVFDCGHAVDKTALSYIPSGLEHLYPVCVEVDGNCMPRSISLSLFSSQDFHEEIRCRICIDSVINKDHYLNLPQKELDMLCTLSECQGATVKEIF